MLKTRYLLLFILSFNLVFQGNSANIAEEDRLVLSLFWKYANEHKLSELSVDYRIPIVGKFFLEKPYKGGTLNTNQLELPSVNLQELDCVTFVEVTLSLSLLEKYDEDEMDNFIRNIVKIRYRNQQIIDYTSRLHYSSDWLFEMDKSGVLKDVTQLSGGEKFPLNVSYMTENPSKYIPLSSDHIKKQMKEIETTINARTHYYIPCDKIKKSLHRIKSGDIILITTNIKGLDTCHIGIAVKKDGKTYLLHASEREKKVVISDETLDDYIARNSRFQTGIMLGRMSFVKELMVMP